MTDRHVVLPKWLDDLIFQELGAEYCRTCGDMTVIDWDRADVLKYLGTYFPRSYAESFCIFKDYFLAYRNDYVGREELSLFDFGCGTGGEIVGLLDALRTSLPHIRKLYIKAFDGNPHALQLCEEVLGRYGRRSTIQIEAHPSAIEITDFYDLGVFGQILKRKFDLFISFKAICEFVTKQEFEEKNPYQHIVETFAPMMNDQGRMCLVDVSSYSQVSQDWLPKMLDRGLSGLQTTQLMRNSGWNEAFRVSHSQRASDLSKVTWRIFGI